MPDVVPRARSRTGPRSLATCLSVALVAGLTAGCKPKVPQITAPFTDDFERAELGPQWLATGPGYRLEGGRLGVAEAYNHPAWLRQRLPRDVVVEISAVSNSPSGDIKVELFGDGESFDPDRKDYSPTGYVFIFGGWGNSKSIIARLYEHETGEKVARTDVHVEPGRKYQLKITRKGATLDWEIDGKPFLSWTDPEPLAGAGHEYFAVNNWQANVSFDDLRIRPAP